MTAQKRSRTKATTSTQLTTGTVIRIEEPKSNRQRKPSVTEIVVEANPATGFVEWLRKNAVVGLAVGFVVGAQVQLLARQLIDSFINPLFLLLFGQTLTSRSFTLTFHGRTAVFTWGAFAYGLLSFLFVLLAIYVILKILKLDKLDKPKEKK